ncbi:MAG: CDP-alcohol phosphatidyltransferase family protein [Gemmatimonadaceae bacterium]
MNRRELRTRSRAWPSAIARSLARSGITPNQVSVASMAFAALSAWAYYVSSLRQAALMLVVAAAGIQLRLLCNLLDGLLAIEGGLKSKTGDLYNELPDRAADIVILLGAGFAVRGLPWGLWIAVAAAMLAVLTAYVRLLGGSLGLKQDFAGPMAKQHRMFVLTLGSLAAAVERAPGGASWSLYLALGVIAAGSAFTLLRRVRRIARALEAR